MLTACLGLAALVRPLRLGRRVRQYAAMAAVAGALAVLAVLGGRVQRWEGLVLVLAYVALVAVVWWRERQPPTLGELAELEGEEDEVAAAAGRAPAVALGLSLVGVVLMVVGGDLAVRGAERVVTSLGRTDSAVGLTVLALATTAELFALVLAALRRDVPEIALAGVVGSAAYNATATLGAAALVRPLPSHAVVGPAVLALVLTVGVLALGRRGSLGRLAGAVLVLAYAVYVVLVLR